MGKEITLNHITKIEGHAKLNLKIDKGEVSVCELSSTEGSRYFEGIVRDRKFFEAHEMTSRICGICSCAHTVAAIHAIEDALGFQASDQTKALRVLLTLGERIRSHATHLYFLSLPDYTGYESALAMAPKFKPELKDALSLMKIGNQMVKVVGGRDLHPVSATVGGWLNIPTKEKLDELKKGLESVKEAGKNTGELFSSLKYPEFKSEGDWFSLSDPYEFAVLEGKLKSKASSFEKENYREFIKENHESRSTSNFVVKSDHRYMVGALARLNNNHEFLSEDAKEMLKFSGLELPSVNPYLNNVAQAVELIHCIDHAIKLCDTLEPKEEKVEELKPKEGTGIAAIEVPRGTLWHEYTLDNKGTIKDANIITPTAQNLLNIQEDIRAFVPSVINKSKEDIIMDVEKLIRSYDPCFSCSAHFLEVNWL